MAEYGFSSKVNNIIAGVAVGAGCLVLVFGLLYVVRRYREPSKYNSDQTLRTLRQIKIHEEDNTLLKTYFEYVCMVITFAI